MAEQSVRVTVERVAPAAGTQLTCRLRVGDFFEAHGSALITPNGPFCAYAMAAVFPVLTSAQGELTAEHWLSRKPYICCPDPRHGVLMRLERIEAPPLGRR